jgi:hypothetical protein
MVKTMRSKLISEAGLRRGMALRFTLALTCLVVCPASPCYAGDGGEKLGDVIQYQGKSIKLRKSYRDYEEFRNDPNHLSPSEAASAAKLVEMAPFPKRFSDRQQMLFAAISLKFPGYSLRAFGDRPKPDGSVLALFGVEMPQSGRTRYLLLRKESGSFHLVDDFVYPDADEIADLTVRDGKFVYLSRQGVALVERASLAK